MKHPRYLNINNRPVFKILIPEIFISECGGNATFAEARLEELRQTAVALGVGKPLIGGGWENPSVPNTGGKKTPTGYVEYKTTNILCNTTDSGGGGGGGGDSCVLHTQHVNTAAECQSLCNNTAHCVAITLHSPVDRFDNATDRKVSPFSFPTNESLRCSALNKTGPGSFNQTVNTYVVVPKQVQYEWTGSYNAAPPVCPDEPGRRCPRYNNSWMPNRTAQGAQVFPYKQCGDYQGAARTNHSNDRVPYLANVIAGFDPRPWEEHSPSFEMPTAKEWEAVLHQVKEQCEDPSNRFGFPDESKVNGYQPAFNIYAWNEFGEGGILAPCEGQGYMMVNAIAKVFGREGGGVEGGKGMEGVIGVERVIGAKGVNGAEGVNKQQPPRPFPTRSLRASFSRTTPTIDGILEPGEWSDAFNFSTADAATGTDQKGPNVWSAEFSNVTDAADSSLVGFVKYDRSSLLFGFNVTDDFLYAVDGERWCPAGNEQCTVLNQTGWPWFGDEMEILLNAAGKLEGDHRQTNVVGNETQWQMVTNLMKSRLGGIGVGGLLEGEPRASDVAWHTYQHWIETGSMRSHALPHKNGKGYVVEWAIDFELMQITKGQPYHPSMPDTEMGINIALGDVDTKALGDKRFGIRHENWFSGGKRNRTHLAQFGSLVMVHSDDF